MILKSTKATCGTKQQGAIHMKKLIFTILLMTISTMFLQIDTEAYSGMYRLYRNSPSGEHYGLYKFDNVMYLYDESGVNYQPYSGFTKTSKGNRRLYVTGDICKGWRKIGEKWYYFDFFSGNAMSKKEKIANGYYYFNDDYSWNGKCSKNAVYPDDFSLSLIISNMDSDTVTYNFDSSSRRFIQKVGEKTEKEIKLSKMDIQAVYSMVLSCNIADIKAKVTGYNIENDLLTGDTLLKSEDEFGNEEDAPDDTDYIWSDPEMYYFSVTFNGNEYKIIGDDSAFLFIDSDDFAEKFCQMVWFIKDFDKNCG